MTISRTNFLFYIKILIFYITSSFWKNLLIYFLFFLSSLTLIDYINSEFVNHVYNEYIVVPNGVLNDAWIANAKNNINPDEQKILSGSHAEYLCIKYGINKDSNPRLVNMIFKKKYFINGNTDHFLLKNNDLIDKFFIIKNDNKFCFNQLISFWLVLSVFLFMISLKDVYNLLNDYIKKSLKKICAGTILNNVYKIYFIYNLYFIALLFLPWLFLNLTIFVWLLFYA